MLILGQKIVKQIAEAVQSLLDFRLVSQVLHDALIVARERFQLGNKMGVGQMPNVKQQLQIARVAIFMTKAE